MSGALRGSPDDDAAEQPRRHDDARPPAGVPGSLGPGSGSTSAAAATGDALRACV